MDVQKIGAFIAAERKAKNLTQAALAEQIHVSEKTISKWENGKGLPDTESLPLLSACLGVTVNELLSGERIVTENVASKADEKILELQRQKEQGDKRLLFVEIVFGVCLTLSVLVIYIVAMYGMMEMGAVVVPSILIVFAMILLIVGMTCCLYIEQKAGYYVCAHCGKKHVPTLLQVVFAMHVNRTRFMKCPDCKKWSWQKKVVK